MNTTPTPQEWHTMLPQNWPAIVAVLAVVAGLALLLRGRKTVRNTGRVVSLVSRVVLVAAGIVGVQWVVLTRTTDVTLKLVVLAAPALLAAAAVTKSLTITTATTTSRRGGDRR